MSHLPLVPYPLSFTRAISSLQTSANLPAKLRTNNLQHWIRIPTTPTCSNIQTTRIPGTNIHTPNLPGTYIHTPDLPSTLIQCTKRLPSTVLPGTILPGTILPGTVLPASILSASNASIPTCCSI